MARHHHELVPSPSGQQVGRTQRGGQPSRGGPQDHVTDAVAERIVDCAQGVQVEKEQSGWMEVIPAAGLLSRLSREAAAELGEPFGHRQPVREARKRVMRRVMAQLLLGLTPFGDVIHQDDEPLAAHERA